MVIVHCKSIGFYVLGLDGEIVGPEFLPDFSPSRR
jgi:hypothetical protein